MTKSRTATAEALASPRYADPDAVVAMAAQRRKPPAVIRDDALSFALRIVEGEETDADLALLRQPFEHSL